MSNTPLPEPDVSWQDGQDQYGYVTYDHAYSAEAMHAHAAAVSAERDAEIAGLRDGDEVSDYLYLVMCQGGKYDFDRTIWFEELDAAIDAAMAARKGKA